MTLLEGDPPAAGRERIIVAFVSPAGVVRQVSFDLQQHEVAQIDTMGMYDKMLRPALTQLLTKGGH